MKNDELMLNLVGQYSDIGDLKKKMLEEEVECLPEMDKDCLNIVTLYIFDLGNKLEVTTVVRSTLDVKLNFKKMNLILLNEENQRILIDGIDFSLLGELPKNSATPFTFVMNKPEGVEGIDYSKCKVQFADNLHKHLSSKINKFEILGDVDILLKRKLEKYLEEFPPVEQGNMIIQCPFFEVYEDYAVVTVAVFNSSANEQVIPNLDVSLVDHLGLPRAFKVLDHSSNKVGPFSAAVVIVKLDAEYIYSDIDELRQCDVRIGISK